MKTPDNPTKKSRTNKCENLKNWLVQFPSITDNHLNNLNDLRDLHTQEDLEKSCKAFEAITKVKLIENVNYIITVEELFKLCDYSTNNPNQQLYIRLLPEFYENNNNNINTNVINQNLIIQKELTDNFVDEKQIVSQKGKIDAEFKNGSANISKEKIPSPREFRNITRNSDPDNHRHRRSSSPLPVAPDARREFVDTAKSNNIGLVSILNAPNVSSTKKISPRSLKKEKQNVDDAEHRACFGSDENKMSPRKIKIYEKEYRIDFNDKITKYSIFILDCSLNSNTPPLLYTNYGTCILVCQGLVDSLVDTKILKDFKEKVASIKVIDKRIFSQTKDTIKLLNGCYEEENNTRKIDVKVYASNFIDYLIFPIFFVIGFNEEYTIEEFLGLLPNIMNECKK